MTRTTQSGFVLIEAIVAIGVCVLMVVGALGLMQRSAQSTRHATDVVIASYLAQDALEWVIARHDFNVINSFTWLTDLTTPSGQYGVDTRGTDIGGTALEQCTSLNASTGCLLEYDSVTGEYGYGMSGASSPYTRTVTVNELVVDKEALVTVTVSWDEGGRTESLSINHRLYKY